MVLRSLLRSGGWTRTNRKYFTNWKLSVSHAGKVLWHHDFDPTGKRILIVLSSGSLGDTLSWAPYAEEFRKKYNCEVFLHCNWIDLFKDEYPELHIQPFGSTYEDIYASYSVGCWEGESDKNPNHWQTINLQQIATDILGLPYTEIRPKISVTGKPPIDEKYVVVAPHSTMQAKYWLDDRWNEVVKYVKDLGYEVISLSKENNRLEGVIPMTGGSIEEAVNIVDGSEFLMTIGNGISWLGFACNKPVVLVSGFSEHCEFKSKCYRIYPTHGCRGCFNNPDIKFDRGDWNWCNNKKLGGKAFECAYNISVDMVKDAINLLIQENISC